MGCYYQAPMSCLARTWQVDWDTCQELCGIVWNKKLMECRAPMDARAFRVEALAKS